MSRVYAIRLTYQQFGQPNNGGNEPVSYRHVLLYIIVVNMFKVNSDLANIKYLFSHSPTTVAVQQMPDHIYRKFPDHIEGIQAMLQKDATFREICADYEEMCNWLKDYCRSQGRPSEECDHARELIRNLENDIKRVLRDAEI